MPKNIDVLHKCILLYRQFVTGGGGGGGGVGL
jgi:hypothetical protein